MSHITLLKNGYSIVAIGDSFTAYQLDNIIIVKFDGGTYKVYKIARQRIFSAC
jgi:hypothetical protein